jgi:hypothetical protein
MSGEEFYYTNSAVAGGSYVGWDTWRGCSIHTPPAMPTFASIKLNEPLKEGIEMKNLYEVFLVYGEDRTNPLIHRTADAGYVVAENDEDAKIKSGIFSMIKPEWDADYLTIIVLNLGAVKIKEKAKEVKNV